MLIPHESRPHGFSLIELMITVTILSLLMLVAAPAMATWIADSRVRTAAESIQNALRLAQSQAMSRNRLSVFALTSAKPEWNAKPTENGSNWYVQLQPLSGSDEAANATAADFFVQSNAFATQSGVSIDGPSLLCFGPLGQQAAVDKDSTTLGVACKKADPAVYTVSNSSNPNSRALKVFAYLGGRVRMCDPSRTLSSEHPDGC
ncbi:MAG: GspH/FimT family pseudopilin [Burkholderiales bacterium]|jgi:type IV fimbrial biogenesis protein FimT|nr:GspH/FimT family pseudopilin [Burkholderiales bacterium]